MAKRINKDIRKKASGRNKILRTQDLKIFGVLLLVFGLIVLYHIVFRSNVIIKSEKYFVYIPPNTTTVQLVDFFKEKKIISNGLSLKVLSGWLDFTPPVKGGLYLFEKDWSNYQLIKNLNDQEPVPSQEISIPAIRHRNSLVRILARELDLDKDKFRQLLKDSLCLQRYQPFNKESIYCIFIPGRYFIPKNSSEEDVIERMHEEFLNFWNDERLKKAETAKLSAIEATILASIVYAETKNMKEMPLIAGVYINRLKSRMKLESDPTLVYATGTFSSRRVYKNRKVLFPAYNTYAKKGLPPGPIYFPTVKAIEAVLNYYDHEYIYFCAKDDDTGCHNFASSYRQHKENAEKYRQYLNSKKIF